MKIPFDIKFRPQIESGEYKVVTRNGNPVRIICWDRHYKYPILGLIEYDDVEATARYNSDGLCAGQADHPSNLFVITPESELTPLAQVLSDYLKNDFEFFARKEWDEKKWNEVMNTQAAELLAIAKKEICKGCTVGLDQYWKGREDARKETEKSYTFHYPTYWPPCYHGGACTNPMRDCINCPMHSSGATTNTTSGTCKKED